MTISYRRGKATRREFAREMMKQYEMPSGDIVLYGRGPNMVVARQGRNAYLNADGEEVTKEEWDALPVGENDRP